MAVVVVFFLVRINIYWIFFRRFHEYHSAVLNQLPGVPLRSVCLFLFDRHRLGFFLWIQQQKKRGVHNKPSPASFLSSSKTGQSYIEFLLEPLEPALFCLFFVFFVVFFVRWDQNWKWGSDARWHGTKETKRNAVPLLLTGWCPRFFHSLSLSLSLSFVGSFLFLRIQQHRNEEAHAKERSDDDIHLWKAGHFILLLCARVNLMENKKQTILFVLSSSAYFFFEEEKQIFLSPDGRPDVDSIRQSGSPFLSFSDNGCFYLKKKATILIAIVCGVGRSLCVDRATPGHRVSVRWTAVLLDYSRRFYWRVFNWMWGTLILRNFWLGSSFWLFRQFENIWSVDFIWFDRLLLRFT